MFVDVERETDHEAIEEGLTLEQFTGFMLEIQQQPAWRTQADKEMDYKDGNQLDSDILQKMATIGMPPAIEPLIGPAIESILGAEAKRRTDWRVIPDGDKEGQEVADAYNYKLNQAERKSRADRSCSDAYESQVSVGVGWVEVSREDDPFKYPYRTNSVHRNEIWFDWPGYLSSAMGDNARFLIRMKWVDKNIAKLMFPDHADLLEHSISGWAGFDSFSVDGGASTGLAMSAIAERGWSIEEQQWRDVGHRKIRLFEVWYRTWEKALVLKMPDGRIVELDQDEPMHMLAVSSGIVPQYATISKEHRSWWAGPHKLSDEPSPYLHKHFQYVPFWGHREDRTGVPFGRIRSMMYMQDNINASISKIRWGLSATVTTRTEGVVLMDDEQFRQEISRPDADVVLSADEMARPGSVFKVDRNFELNEQQYKMLADARNSLQKVGGVSDEFSGNNNKSTSGVQFNSQIEQSVQSLANIDDNFAESRAQVGELLLSMIVQDSIGKQEDVRIDGGLLKEDRVIGLNCPCRDEDTGLEYLNNDVERTLLKVVLSDVPQTSSYRVQQLATLGEAFKSSPPQYQQIMMPHLLNLMDVPDKDEIIKAIKESSSQPSPESMEQDRKMKELEIKQMMTEAQIKNLDSRTTEINAKALYEFLQVAQGVVANPEVVPVADQVGKSSGFKDADGGNIINVPTGQLPAGQPLDTTAQTDPTSPNSPASPYNREQADMEQSQGMPSPAVGVAGGIEQQGNQIQARATGGPVNAGQPYLVGENGPELVIPKNSGYVLNNDQTVQAFGHGMSGAPMPTQDSPDYDIKGYVEKYGEPDQSKGQHLTDEFKLPNHITF
ncbi:MAG: hypothetical protein Q8L15_18470 [Methylobacter sp.]|nr:hypothetical protein [Methylobacter sp.]